MDEAQLGEQPLVNVGLRSILRMAVAPVLTLLFGTADGYQLAQRWTSTASGVVVSLGTPLTLTWSLLPDGTRIDQVGSSHLVSFLDTTLGSGQGGADLTQRPWFPQLADSFARWSQLSGVTFVYEPHDDGVPHGNFPGILGVRGDIRLGGAFLDGGGGLLGYSFRPNNGDIVIDTSETVLFGNAESNYLRMRSILMHELGHSLGLAHVDSSDAAFLMEFLLTYQFDGPQVDDVRGIHRASGDAREKHNGGAGNDSFANAIMLGTLTSSSSFAVGVDAGTLTSVDAAALDFVSIDDGSDLDFYAFDVLGPGTVDVRLTPLGPSYLQGPLGGQQTTTIAASISDLSLALLDRNGTSILRSANSQGLGGAEQILGLQLSEPGRYFVRVAGTANDVQLYRLDVSGHFVPEPTAGVGVVWLIGLLGRWRSREFGGRPSLLPPSQGIPATPPGVC